MKNAVHQIVKSLALCGLLSASALTGAKDSVLSEPTGGAINTIDIIKSGTSLSCMEWGWIGECMWLVCDILPPRCNPEFTFKVRHYIPQAVVQVFEENRDAPWAEMNFLTNAISNGSKSMWEVLGLPDIPGVELSGKRRTVKTARTDKSRISKVTTKKATVYGSPASLVAFEMLAKLGLACEPNVVGYYPYYHSDMDFTWKYPYGDMLNLQSWIPTMREVGVRKDGEAKTFLLSERWGNVWPRHGSLVQPNDYKASAVFAQRAANIMTGDSGLHIKLSSFGAIKGKKKRKHYTPPTNEFEEYSSKNGKWQMLYPKSESSCHIFGEHKGSGPSQATGGVVTDGDNAIREALNKLDMVPGLSIPDIPNVNDLITAAGKNATNTFNKIKDVESPINPETKSIDNNLLDEWANRVSPNGGYSWHLWLPYECCKKPRGDKVKYLGAIEW